MYMCTDVYKLYKCNNGGYIAIATNKGTLWRNIIIQQQQIDRKGAHVLYTF